MMFAPRLVTLGMDNELSIAIDLSVADTWSTAKLGMYEEGVNLDFW